MRLEKAVGQDFDVLGVWLFCRVKKGTFPQYYWFLNKSRLESQGSFYSTFYPDHSGLMVMLHPHSASAGVYHCEAINSFDNTTSVSGPDTLVTHEGNRTLTIWSVINTKIKKFTGVVTTC